MGQRTPQPCLRVSGFLVPRLMVLLVLILLGRVLPAAGQSVPSPDAAEPARRGEYLFRASGGCGCHTDHPAKGAFLAGGRPVHSPYGNFRSTNITPDPETGLGRWSEADFIRAMTLGIGPKGQHYFPVFPYTSFTRMRRSDLSDLWAYLRTVPAVRRENQPHEVAPPYGWRFPLPGWKWLYFHPGELPWEPERSAAWNRGAYLVLSVGHCGECHSPRTVMGGLRRSRVLAGGVWGPEDVIAANLTPHPSRGLGKWSLKDISWLLKTGFKPDGENVQAVMGEMIDEGYSYLTDGDLQAIAEYVRALPPQP
ncbi:MAG: cytochrome c [Deltaproteobacteria bacterium]|nr:cytochrome c [Deltaproteobacteria bacterium]